MLQLEIIIWRSAHPPGTGKALRRVARYTAKRRLEKSHDTSFLDVAFVSTSFYGL